MLNICRHTHKRTWTLFNVMSFEKGCFPSDERLVAHLEHDNSSTWRTGVFSCCNTSVKLRHSSLTPRGFITVMVVLYFRPCVQSTLENDIL